MSDYPDEWKVSKFDSLFTIAIGGTPSRVEPLYWDSNFKSENHWVSIRDLKQKKIIHTKERLTELGIKKSNVKLIPKGSLLMSFKLSVGKLAIAGQSLYTNEAIAAFLPKDNRINMDYCYQGMQHWDLLRDIDQAVKGVTLNKEKLAKLEAILPPLPEQQKIAAILSSVDEVIEKTQAQINKLKDLKTGMMQELLSPREGQAANGTGTQGKNGAGLHHSEFKDSPLGRIPVGWEVAKFKDVFIDYKYGPRFSSKDYSPNGNVKTIRGTDVANNGEVHYQQVPTAQIDADTVEAHKLKDGDLVMITTADCGASAVFREQNIPYIASAYAIKLTPTDKVIPAYIKFFMQTSNAMTQIESFIRKGTVANLPGSDVMNIELALPPIKSQEKISSILNALEDKIELVIKKNIQLKHTKKALMQDLLTGKVRVKVD